MRPTPRTLLSSWATSLRTAPSTVTPGRVYLKRAPSSIPVASLGVPSVLAHPHLEGGGERSVALECERPGAFEHEP